MKLSIVIPVYNEKKTIIELLKIVENSELPLGVEKEIIIVDDYSTDGTRELLKDINGETKKVFFHDVNKGKGAALRTGYAKCTGDVIIVQDADLEYDPNEYSKLITPIIKGEADIVYGSRFAGGQKRRVLYFWHSVCNKVLTLISNIFTDLNLTDMETCYKAFKREVIEKITLEEDRFGIEPEFTAKMAALVKIEKLQIYEVGISYKGRSYEDGKKIGFKDALRALWCIWKYNSTYIAKTIKYAVHGIIVASFQIALMWIFVSSLNLKTIQSLNTANIICTELALLLAFILHYKITWTQHFISKRDLFVKLIKFHAVTFTSFFIRIVLFYLILILTDINYIANTAICVLVAICINFMGYDKVVFREPFLEPLLRLFRLKKIEKWIRNIPNCNLLDLGCGYNHKFLSSIQPFIAHGVGIDFKVQEFSENNIEIIKQKFSDKLPFDDSVYNAVTMLAVLEHIENPVEICREISRVLKPDGKLFITVPTWKAKGVLEFLAYKLHIVSKEEILDHKRYYDKDDIYALIDKIPDLEIEHHEYFQVRFNNFCVIRKRSVR